MAAGGPPSDGGSRTFQPSGEENSPVFLATAGGITIISGPGHVQAGGLDGAGAEGVDAGHVDPQAGVGNPGVHRRGPPGRWCPTAPSIGWGASAP